MKISNISLLLVLFLVSLAQSCSNETFERDNYETQNEIYDNESKTIESLDLNQADKLKLKFGKAIALAIKENQDLRRFIKIEALKKFNKDYDVLYHAVKDQPLNYRLKANAKNSSVLTLSRLLGNYFEDKDELAQIEQQLPLLTIFVPELPENSFSAETWEPNDAEQIPVVAIRLETTNEVPMIDVVNNYEYVLEQDLIPGYPVVVIKNNERVVVNNNSHNFGRSTKVLNTQSGLSYRFLDDDLSNNDTSLIYDGDGEVDDDGSFGGGSGSVPCNPGFAVIPGREMNVAPFLKTAHNIFDGAISQPWQRDNIYYQLTPTVTTNKYVGGKYLEAITYFQLQGDADLVFNRMANQTNGSNPDPKLKNQDWSRDRRVPWTDGNFEIGISITDNAKNRPNINFTLAFNASADDLFTYTHESVVRRRGAWPIRWKRTYWRPIIDGFKGMDFTSLDIDATVLQIHAWDLTEYSNIWNVEVKELDFTTEISTKTSNVKKYNTNVNIDTSIPLGDKIKVGLKYGASMEETNTDERNEKWVEGSDFLGLFEIPFSDKAVIKNHCDNQLYPRLYRSSNSIIEMRPVQVEF